MNKIIISLFIISVFTVVVIGAVNWNVAVIVNVAPNSCFDSDGGIDYMVKGNTSAMVVVPNYWPPGTNSTIPASVEDNCGGEILFEGVCGAQFGYPTLGGILSMNCSELGNYTCSNGACVSISQPLWPLVAQWHFDEGFGTTTADSSGYGNTGTINGATWTAGFSGNALQFNGINNLVTTIHSPSIDLTQQVEIEAWVRHDALGYGTIVSKNGPYILAIYGNKVHGGVYTNDGNCPVSCTTPGANTWTEIDGTTNLQVGVWYKLKMKYDGNTLKVYVNDIEENSAPKIGQMPQVSQNLNIGWGEPGQNFYFNGIIDEISVRGI